MNLYVYEPREERRPALLKELRSAGLDAQFLGARTFNADRHTLSKRLVDEAAFLIADSEDAPEQIESLRAGGCEAPVIVMRDMRNARRTAQMLDAGADDDMIIPIKGPELRARLRSVARRAAGHAGTQVRIGELTVYLDGRDPEIEGQAISLSGREHRIFAHLAMNQNRIVSKHNLYDALYALSEDRPYDKVIDVYICKLRKKLAAASAFGHVYIETVHRRGYTLTTPMAVAAIAAE